MSNIISINIVRFIGLLLLQVLIIKQIKLGLISGGTIQIDVYPLFILLLPFKMTREFLLSLGFLIGILVDYFYNSAGLHASATVFLAFARPYILNVLEPSSGYDSNKGLTPARIKWVWFVQYTAFSLFLHALWFHLVDAFDFALLGTVLVKTLSSGTFSLIFVIIIIAIFNPKD